MTYPCDTAFRLLNAAHRLDATQEKYMITSSRMERTTALTDLFLCFLAVYILLQFTGAPGFKFQLWVWAFAFLAGAAFLGFVVHWFAMTEKAVGVTWIFLRLCLGLGFGFIVAAAVYDLNGEPAARQSLPWALSVIVLNLAVIVLAPSRLRGHIVFLYQLLSMLFALAIFGIYIFLVVAGSLRGAGWIVSGMAVTLAGGVVQAVGRKGNPIFWSFDSNGMFHLIQMAGLILIMIGLKSSM